MIKAFHFKQFSVFDHESTMKVNTDGVLLGCFARCPKDGRILEIGTGSGYIALMMAQKSSCDILAIDIDEASCRQANTNFIMSEWGSRLQAKCMGVQLLAAQDCGGFNLIVSNPPFHTEAIKSIDSRKRNARHADELSFEELIISAVKLLEDKGRFEVVIPYTACASFVETAIKHSLFPERRMNIIPLVGKECNRVLISFAKNVQNMPKTDCLVIRDENHRYTDAYKNYVSAFYLDFPY